MIIVEGLDNSGKTTLINKLLEWFPDLRLKPKIVPKTGEIKSKQQLTSYMDKFVDLPRRKTSNLLFDRFPAISEAVYGPVMRGSMAFSQDEWLTYIDMLAWHKPLVIYCRIPLERVLETFGERSQMTGVINYLAELEAEYQKVMNFIKISGVSVIEYNWTNHTEGSIREAVRQYLP